MCSVTVLERDVHDEIRMKVTVGLADVEPAVDHVVPQERPEDLDGGVEMWDRREVACPR
ncbi:Uncharacterised protein [Mycobacteroides abscessus subsp. abscessus]|nr:Uncharacterised protein [Mycobacteroides abscessus subsp. abscessus]